MPRTVATTVWTIAISTILASAVNADFIVDKEPGGNELKIAAQKDGVSSYTGVVETESSKVLIDIFAKGTLNLSKSGGEGEEEGKGGTLTDLIFKPYDFASAKFSQFSFKGQLDSKANGTVEVIVTDNNDKIFDFKFTNLGKNEDFDRIGVTANTAGEYIKSIELKSIFTSEKENEFSRSYRSQNGSEGKNDDGKGDGEGEGNNNNNNEGEDGGGSPAPSPVPEPSTFALLGLGGVAAGFNALRRRRRTV